MGAGTNGRKSNPVLIWIVAVSVTLAAFYLVDHVVMSLQGLPLDWDLSPAN